ncbi:MAG: hypothetical protein J6X77_01415 [Bacteroidales bacterium]|nr:hypothetical protein [Bacteroidales bacterium]
MKRILSIAAIMLATVAFVSCGASKKQAGSPAPGEVTQTETVEGTTVNQAPWSQFGYAMGEGYKSGKIVEVPFVYFTAVGESNNQRIAEEMARSAAYSLISNTFNVKNIDQKVSNAISEITDESTEDEVSRVTRATEDFSRYLSQVSTSTVQGFTPFGETVIQFDQESRIYKIWARVGMPAKNWEKIYKNCLNYKPKSLSNKELKAFEKVQNDILGTIFQIEDDEEEE